MVKEERIKVFIEGVNRFFNEVNNLDVEISPAYLVENSKPQAFDYTGMIGVTGPYKGCVYFSAPSVLLRHLLVAIGETDVSEENMTDLVGEIANTISGNARSEYGDAFMISVPMTIRGAPDEIYLPKDTRSYVIPINWRQYNASIVVCLQNNN